MEVVTTLLSVPAVIAVVNFMKQYGLSTKLAPFVSLIVGAIFGLIASYIQYQGFNISPFLMGVVTGFSASGIYDITKTSGGSNVSVDSASTVNVNQPAEVSTPITGTTPICNTPETPQVIQNQPEIATSEEVGEGTPAETIELSDVAEWGEEEDPEDITPKG